MKNKHIKTDTIKLVARQPRKIKRVLKSWVAASEGVNMDPLGLDAAPPWVEKAWIEVVKVIMPGNRLPTSGEMDLETLGRMFGRLQAFGKMLAGEIPIAPQVEAELDRFLKFAESQPKSPERSAREKMLAQDFQVRVGAVQAGIPNLMSAVMASSHEDALNFQKGLLQGMTLSPDEMISANVFERHTRTFFVLALFWRFWVTRKSLGEVHRILCQKIGEDKIGSFKTFENRVAKKIGLKVRDVGRPKGEK